ncbi:helix-turn-helix transcriptional regulator [Erythrobacter ani]|uniref:Helix-turn-helix transcriptional regulator n=1 Tax=Erythrobacter ani TaxID=2827235 RepID=A0ABS6SKE2_9SPHN|nr:AraC family transcriptional regulator [Erythrobacter ani]MBV7265455.1 helix-turn-helix transcriptional regulator [Erythrobacter ani]
MTTQPSFADWYKQAYAGFPQEHRAAGASGLEMFHVEQDSHETVDEMGDNHALVLVHKGPSNSVWDFGYGKSEALATDNALMVQPATSAPEMRIEGRHSLTMLAFPASSCDRLLGQDATAGLDFAPLTRDITFRDRETRHLVLSLWDTSAREGPMAGLKVDSLFQLLLIRLTELSGAALKNDSNARLSAEEINAACAMIEDCLSDKLTIPQIAAEIGISPYHFARQFKAQTGDTLHGYLMERRLERAKRALEAANDGIADIAYDCGFSSQQHMTSAFTKHLGITPARYRREVSG